MGKVLRRLVAGLVILSALWIVGGKVLAGRWAAEADAAWTALGTPMTAFAARFPKRGQNEPARKVDETAAKLGIAMAAAGAAGRPQPSAADAKAFEAVKPDLSQWLDAQVGKPSDEIAAPAGKLAAFLSAHASEVRALASELRAGEAPVWAQDIDMLADAPIPFLRGHRALNNLLCASALEAQRQGHGAEALELVEAAIAASSSLQGRADLISQMIHVALLGSELATLRKLEGVPAPWQSRAREPDVRKSTIGSLQGEAWLLAETLRRSGPVSRVRYVSGGAKPQAPTFWSRVSAFYEKPYALLAAADYSRALARAAAALQEQKGCAFEPEALRAVDDEAKDEIGRWNVIGRIAVPSVAQAWAAVDRLRFHQELTAKVLKLKELKATSADGSWPREVPGIESSVCPGNRWTYVVTADGGALLTASQSPSKNVPAVSYKGAPPAPARPAARRTS